MTTRPPSRARIDRVMHGLADLYPVTTLGKLGEGANPFQVLIGTILSARTRDQTTDEVSARLFRRYPDATRLARARLPSLEKLIEPVGFYRQKAKHIRETARLLEQQHQGQVPRDLESLLQLPGVGRKVANCVLVYAFHEPAIPVDTHVHRISNRLGWVETETPEATEQALLQFLPRKHWLQINEVMVAHGKAICRPQVPQCEICNVRRDCPLGELNPKASG